MENSDFFWGIQLFENSQQINDFFTLSSEKFPIFLNGIFRGQINGIFCGQINGINLVDLSSLQAAFVWEFLNQNLGFLDILRFF